MAVYEGLRHSTPNANGTRPPILTPDQKGKGLIKSTPKIFEQWLSISK